MSKKCGVGSIFYVLMIVGGVNWGLVGLGALLQMNLNVVNLLLGKWPMVEAIVYILVGISAVVAIFGGCKCETCKMGAEPMAPKSM